MKGKPVAIQNTFKADYTQKLPLWAHSANRKDTQANMLYGFMVLLAFILFVICLFVAVDLYPAAYPKTPVVKHQLNP